MLRATLLAFVFTLLAASVASADVPLPKNLKYVDPRVSFDGVEKHKDHVFYLRFLTFSGGPANIPHRLVEVKDSKPFNLKAQRRLINMSLLAMERKEFDKRAKDDPSLKWLTDKAEGVLAAAINSPATTGPANAKEVAVTTYRVALKDGALSAPMVKNTERSDATPAGLMPMWLFGLISALSLSSLGIWAARRRRT